MADILESVKSALGITGTYQDDTLSVYVDEVKNYMVDAGVPEVLVASKVSAGVIARGVTDLWNYNGGAGKLSEYFYQRVTQLVYALTNGKIIYFSQGDWGITFPVNIEGVEIAETDTVTFTCGELVKTLTGVANNCVLITFSEAESNALPSGTHKWSLKITKDNAVVTAVNDGILIVI